MTKIAENVGFSHLLNNELFGYYLKIVANFYIDRSRVQSLNLSLSPSLPLSLSLSLSQVKAKGALHFGQEELGSTEKNL